MRVASVVVLAACSASDSRSFSGEVVNRYLTTSGAIDLLADLRGTAIELYAGNPPQKLSNAANVAALEGTFTFDDVPSGDVVLHLGRPDGVSEWTQLPERTVTVKRTIVGRPNAEPAVSPSSIELVINGLAAWKDGDELVASCFENGSHVFDMHKYISPPPEVGTTSINGVLPWAGFGQSTYLIDGRVGDSFAMSRIDSTVIADGMTLNVLTQVADGAIVQEQGQVARFAARADEVVRDTTLRIVADKSDFDALTPDGGSSRVSISVMSGPGADEGVIAGPALLHVTSVAQEAIDVTEGFGNPYDANWPVRVYGRFASSRPMALPDMAPALVPTLYMAYEPVASAFHFNPTMPRYDGVRINGQPVGERFIVHSVVDGVEISVDIDRPFEGFIAELFELYDLAGTTAFRLVAIYESRTDRIMLPPHALNNDSYYALRVGHPSKVGWRNVVGKFRVAAADMSRCGDGVVDPNTHEVCDDGNAADGDACSSNCL